MKKMFSTLFIVLFAVGMSAQTENPRGIYKMMTLEGKNPPVNAPFDQYKVVTDEITLTLRVESDGNFSIGNNDGETLNYTGSEPRTENDHSTLVFDSNAKHFTLKWWSTESDNIYIPEGGWVTEYYESGKYSEYGRVIFKALLQGYRPDEENPMLGTWRQLGYMDELHNTQKAVASMEENYATSSCRGLFMSILPGHIVYYKVNNEGEFRVQGVAVNEISCPDKNTLKMGTVPCRVTWLDKGIIALEMKDGDRRTDYVIYSRVTSNASLLSF